MTVCDPAPAPGGPRSGARRAVPAGLVVLGLLAAAAAVLVPGVEGARAQVAPALLVTGGWVAAGLLGVPARGVAGSPWRPLAVAAALMGLGQLLGSLRGLGINPTAAGVQDVPLVLALPFALTASSLLTRGRGDRPVGSRTWLDVLLVGVAVAVLAGSTVSVGLEAAQVRVDPLIAVGYPVVGALLCAGGLHTFLAAPAPRRAAAAWLMGTWWSLAVVVVSGAISVALRSPVLELTTALAWLAMMAAALLAAAADPGPGAGTGGEPPALALSGLVIGYAATGGVGLLLAVGIATGRGVTVPETVGAGLLVAMTLLRSLLWAADGARLTRRLAGTEAFFRSLVVDADEVTVVLDPAGRAAWVSEAVRSRLGHDPQELLGRPLAQLVHPQDRAALRELLDGDRGVRPLRLRSRAGQWCPMEAAGRPGSTTAGRVLSLRSGGEQHRRESELQRMAYTDYLTGLPNRARLTAALGVARSRAAEGGPVSLLMLDLDGFKAVNDVAGHEAGDQLLVRVADLLREEVREPDLVARLGGDEFALLVRSGLRDAATLADRVVARLHGEHRALAPDGSAGGPVFAIAASIGVARLDPADDVATTLRQADVALRAAKAAGKSCVRVHGDGLDLATARRARLTRDLPAALAEGQLRVVYQPVVSTGRQRVVGLEALVRWDHPELGVVAPDEFVPLAEDEGLVVPLQRWVLAQACARVAQLHGQGRRVAVGVNVSVRHLQAGCLVPDVLGALAASGLPASALVLEITESVLMTDHVAVVRDLTALRDAGCVVALDDFGRGYSSFAHLARLPVGVLKLDREFLAGIAHDARAAAVVQSVVELARRLRMEVVAEGVETEEELAALRGLGCTLLQGYLLARPAASGDVPTVIELVDAALQARPTERIG